MIDVTRAHVTPPDDLSHDGPYRTHGVLVVLAQLFVEKCYICERKVGHDFQIDHRAPKAAYPDSKNLFDNLFPSCGYCNNRRRRTRLPIAPGEGVEQRIVQRAAGVEHGIQCEFFAVSPADSEAVELAEELRRLHSDDGDVTSIGARHLLDAIADYYWVNILPLEKKILRARNRGEVDLVAELALKNAAGRHQPFTALVRSIIHESLRSLLD